MDSIVKTKPNSHQSTLKVHSFLKEIGEVEKGWSDIELFIHMSRAYLMQI